MKKYKFKLLYVTIALLGFLSACNEGTVPDPGTETKTEASALTQKVNKFINDAMTDVYLWYDQMPDIDYKYETDSKEYFDKLLYEDDKWSYITDDVEALENSFQGVEKTYGWSLAFGQFVDTDGTPTGSYFALVEYVYPNTPAANAGVERGDLIISIGGADITQDNYTDLLYGENLTFTFGEYTAGVGISEGASKTMTALELNLNPVLKTSIVDFGGHKIGYLFYAQYITSYNDAIDTALQSFVAAGVTDVVLDLRYNPGGSVDAAVHLCSSLAPAANVNDEDILVTYRWNDKYQDYWVSSQNVSQIQESFDKTITTNLNLSSIHILTGSGTASASELTITGLDPYMTVTTVGDTTYGKYTASITIKPEDLYSDSYSEEISNWGLQPIILRYANAWGVTDFKNGFAPNIYVYDDLLDAYPLGDVNDPLFAAAIEDITGTSPIVAMKSAQKPALNYRIFDRGFSRFDVNKRELLIGNNIKSGLLNNE